MNVEKISAITIKVNDLARSEHFYNRLLGLKVLYGGENAYFSSLQTLGVKDTILNLEKGHATPVWGRNSDPQGPEMQHGVRGTSI